MAALFSLSSLLSAQTADQAIPLEAGWNAVWLEVEPVYQAGDTALNDPALAGDDEVIAAGDPRIGQPKMPVDVFSNPAIQTVASPKPIAGLSEFFGSEPGQIGTFNQAEWERWLRTDPSGSNNLPLVRGNRPYLVEVEAGTAAFGFTVTGTARFHRPEWTPDRYNLIGFGINGSISFQDFFSPSGSTHPVDRIFELSANGNWTLVAGGDQVEDGVAYWVFSSGPSKYMGPVAVDFDLAPLGTFQFAGPDDAIPVGTAPDTLVLDLRELVFTNLGINSATPALDLISASTGPGSLDLHVVSPAADSLSYDRGNQVDTAPGAGSSAPLGETVSSQSTRILTLGALRQWTTGSVGRTNLYRLTTSSPGAEFWLPVSASNSSIQTPEDLLPETEAGSVAGLWVGEVIVDSVTSIVEDGAPVRPTAGTAPIRILLHSDAGGGVRLLSQVTIMQTKTADPEVEPEPVLVVDRASIPIFEGVRERNGKRVGLRLEAVAFDMPRLIDAASQDALLNDPAYPDLTEGGISDFLNGRNIRPPSLAETYALTWPLEGALGAGKTTKTGNSSPLVIDPFHRSNPFRHAFHQQHSRGPNITRSIAIEFDADQPVADRLTGTFRETMLGPIKSNLELQGRVEMRRVSPVAAISGAQ